MDEEKVPLEKPQKKRVKRIPVSIVEQRGQSNVVEFGDAPFRKVVLKSLIENNSVAEDELEKSPDYGVRWADILKDSDVITTSENRERFEGILRSMGIWTVDDLRQSTMKYLQALSGLHRGDIRAMLKHKEVV